MAYLLDTNIVIDYLKGKDNIVKKINKVLDNGLALSTISLAELSHGAHKSRASKPNLQKINQFISIAELNLLAVDKKIALEYGRLLHELEAKGEELAPLDVLIASTARFHKLTILTQDKKHFPRLKKFKVSIELV